MCGIAGVLDRDGGPVPADVLKRMTEALAHRGPDGEGLYTDGAVGLGHRRLAVIDLSPAGHQPMVSPDGQHALVLNGEIYNHRELRADLERLGHGFHSRSDSEVLLHGYAQWGESVLDRLNGMFAFAVWDRRRRHLFLARDRYGIKPLYYTQVGDAFLFASEVKALLAHPACRAGLDKEALLEYFTFQNLFGERTLFAGVRLLPAGSHLTVPAAGATAGRPTRYWDYAFVEPPAPADDQAYLEELDRLLRQAVTRQLVSDVEVGAYLSGGIDSGSITALAAAAVPALKSFTCGFDLRSASDAEIAFDEREKAELMSYRLGTEHYQMVLKPGDMERAMPRLTWHLEEPRLGQCYPNFYAAKLAGGFVKVVLSGCGGDELFGGYPWRYVHRAGGAAFDDYIDESCRYWQRLLPTERTREVFGPIWRDVSHVSTRDILRGVFSGTPPLSSPADLINAAMYFEARTFLHGLFIVEDKMSMAHGLETRLPFLDNDLVDFAMRMPVRLKLADAAWSLGGQAGERPLTRTRAGKVALRAAMSRYLPAEISTSAKQGFSGPDASWFQHESLDYVRRVIMDPHARIYDYLDRETIQSLVQEHLDGRQNRRLLIWSLISFHWWLETFLG
jgi:asparagine synthase (glutamine-hydrolysing)